MMRRTLGSVVKMRNWVRTLTWEIAALRELVGGEGEKRGSMEICGNAEQEPDTAAAAAETKGASGTVAGAMQSRESRRRDFPGAISVPDLIAVTACLFVRLRIELGWFLQCW